MMELMGMGMSETPSFSRSGALHSAASLSATLLSLRGVRLGSDCGASHSTAPAQAMSGMADASADSLMQHTAR